MVTLTLPFVTREVIHNAIHFDNTSIHFADLSLIFSAALNPSERRPNQNQNHHQQQQQQPSYSYASEKYFFKILCPQSITGIIIGKGGSTINQLNGSTGCSIKLSHNNEYYPGTNDRILLCKNVFQ